MSSTTDRPSENEKQQRIHARLRQARNRADAHDPERITIRELEADLANHELVTSPSFRAVTLDTMVAAIWTSS